METTSSSSSSSSERRVCQECRAQPALYQCPRCSWRTCSLPCCREHKRRQKCSGRRDRTGFLPVGRMDDATLASDYHFLEDVVGSVDAGKRLLRRVGAAAGGSKTNAGTSNKRRRHDDSEETDAAAAEPAHALLQAASVDPSKRQIILPPQQSSAPAPHRGPQPLQHLPPRWRTFQRLAAARQTTVLFMPNGMERHRSNRSCAKKDVLHWTIEWRLHSEENKDEQKRTKTTQTPETSVVGEVLRSLLAEGSSLESVSILLKRLPSHSNRPTYAELSSALTVREALHRATVYEYPTLDVVPHGRLADFPRLIAVQADDGAKDGAAADDEKERIA